MAEDNYERTRREAELREQIAESIKESTKNLESYADAQKTIAKNYKIMKQLAEETARNEAKINELLKESGGILTDEVKALQKINEENRQQYALYQGINKELSKTKNLLKSVGGSILDGAKSLKDQFIPSLSDVFKKFLDIDHLAHQTANTLGFQGSKFEMMADNLAVTREEFIRMGFEAESAYKAQSAMADATGRQVMLTKQASKAMAETARITGMEVEELAGMTGEMEAFGLGAQQATSMILQMSQESSDMGLNSGQVIKKFQQNLGLLNKLNFKAGVKGLKEMAKFSEKYKIDMQDVASVADKVFRPEGAIEAAAQLQVLGGDLAALGDPFQLMYKARNAPEELAKSISKAATASATFNEKTGEFEVNAYELDRMREAASALGMDYSKLVETAKQGAKVKKFEGLLGGKGFDDETMKALTGAAQMGENGAFVTIKGEPKLLKDLSAEEAKAFVNQKKNQSELAQQAMSIQSNIDTIKNEIVIKLVEIFEKNRDMIKSVIVGIKDFVISTGELIKDITDVLGAKGSLAALLGIYFGAKAGWALLQGKLMGMSQGAAAGSIIAAEMTAAGSVVAAEIAAAQTGGGAASAAGGVASTAGKVTTAGGAVSGAAGGGIGGSLTSLAGGLTAMGTPQVLFGALNLIPTAVGMLAMVAAIPTLLVLGLIPLAQLGTNLMNLAIGLEMLGNPLALEGTFTLLSAALAFAAMTLGVIGLAAVAIGGEAAGAGLIGLTAGLDALGGSFPVAILGVAIIEGLALAMMGFGAAVLMVGLGISMIVLSFAQLFESIGPNGSSLLAAGLGFMAMAAGVGILTVSLIALGAASLLALPGLLILGGVTSMLTETATALASTGGGEGISKTINAINSVDTDKLQALKELSLFMSLLGASPTIKFDENLTIDGSIQISGQAGGKKDTEWVNDPIFVNKLKQLISESTEKDKNGGKAR